MIKKAPFWTKHEDRTIIKLWCEGLRISEITARLPGRTIEGVRRRIRLIDARAHAPDRTEMAGNSPVWSDAELGKVTDLLKAGSSVDDMVPHFPNRTRGAIRLQACRLRKDIEGADRRGMGLVWTAADDAALKEAWRSGVPYCRLPEVLPARTFRGIEARVKRLVSRGELEPRRELKERTIEGKRKFVTLPRSEAAPMRNDTEERDFRKMAEQGSALLLSAMMRFYANRERRMAIAA